MENKDEEDLENNNIINNNLSKSRLADFRWRWSRFKLRPLTFTLSSGERGQASGRAKVSSFSCTTDEKKSP